MARQNVPGKVIKAARSIAVLSQKDLAAMAQCSCQAIARLEAFGHEPVQCTGPTMLTITAALAAHGVEFDARGARIAA